MVSNVGTAQKLDLFPESRVARGYVDGMSSVFKFGFSADIGTTEETVWDEGGIYAYPASAEQFTVSSSSANDTSAGTGARTVRWGLLDEDYNEIEETVTLNGQTGVSISRDAIRAFRGFVLTAGSGGINAGDIYIGSGTITAGVPANIYAKINAGEGQTLMAVYTVPAGKQGLLYGFNVSSFSNGNAFATVRLVARSDGGVFRVQDKILITEGSLRIPHVFPVTFAAKTDLEVRAVASSSTIDVSASFELLITDDPLT